MSILIKDIEMPKEGTVFVIDSSGQVWSNEWPARGYTRLDGVTAVPVPPHVDLIGREWLIDIALHLMNTAKNDDIANGVKWLLQYIIDASTIIPASGGKEDE